MQRPTKLYTVREVEGLKTTAEYPRLYAFQAVERLQALGIEDAQGVVNAAGKSGFANVPGVAVLAGDA